MFTHRTRTVGAVFSMGMLLLLGILLAGPAAAADGPPRWSVVLTTAAGQPQDVWVSGMGNNTVGWKGGGVICLGQLAEGFPEGQHATLKADIVQGGVIGPDGFPVAPGTYEFPSEEGGELVSYTVTEGQTFYVVMNIYVVESNFPPFPTGSRFQVMFAFDKVLGNHAVPMFNFLNFGGGFFPFLAEGELKLILKQHP